MMSAGIKSRIVRMIWKNSCAIAAHALLLACGAHAWGQSTILPPPEPAAPPAATPGPAAESVITKVETTPQDPTRFAKLSTLGRAPDWTRLEAFAKTMTRAEVETALKDIYTDGSTFPVPWRIESDALVIQTGDPARPEVRVPFAARAEPLPYSTRSWHRVAELPPLGDKPPLTDIHIAIDPGHIGGNYAAMEERYLSFQAPEAIQEGTLSLITAQVLAERLRALGAYVSLVRENLEPVTTRRPADLRDTALQVLKDAGFPEPAESYDGKTGDAKIITVQWQSEKLFYRVSEIHARGDKVNKDIKPDLVLCLHYNAEAWGNATSPQYSPVNHYHVLVNGCYSPAEVEQADVRFEMFHRLLSRIHEEELPLADAISKGVADATHLSHYVYTTPNAKRVTKNLGVYARNLLANRLYDSPVVYLEPFVMNHEETYRRLLAGHFIGRTLIAGRLQTSAIEDYVRGVTQGLVSYFQSHRKQL